MRNKMYGEFAGVWITSYVDDRGRTIALINGDHPSDKKAVLKARKALAAWLIANGCRCYKRVLKYTYFTNSNMISGIQASLFCYWPGQEVKFRDADNASDGASAAFSAQLSSLRR